MTREEIRDYIKEELMEEEPEIYLDVDDYKVILEVLSAEPNEDCVSRKAILNEFKRCDEELTSITPRFVRELPLVLPKEKVGKWICKDKRYPNGTVKFDWIECSRCGYGNEGEVAFGTPYCPNCGAKMVRP